MNAQPRSKTFATWLAVIGGSLGLHRFYLHGWARPVGLAVSGTDDHRAWSAFSACASSAWTITSRGC